MRYLLQRLQEIYTLVDFQNQRDEIIEFINDDENLGPRDKMRLRDILRRDRDSWYYRLELFGNLYFGEGILRVISYTPQGIQNFLNLVLSRHGFGENRKWSFAELELEDSEIRFLRNFPAQLQITQAMNNNQMMQVVGAVLLLAESLHLQETFDGNLWANLSYLQWKPQTSILLFQGRDGTDFHRELLSIGANTAGIRNGFNDEGNMWQRTFLLQFGFSKPQWIDFLETYLPPTPDGVGADILYNAKDDRHSESFARTWDYLRGYRLGRISRIEAERVMEDSPWIRDEWIPELLDAAQTERIPNQQEIDDDEAEEPNILGEATLVWVNGSPYFKWSINDASINLIPVECKQLELTGPCGWIGRIGRKQNGLGWLRIAGLLLNEDLSFQIPATGLEVSEIGFSLSNPNIGFQISTTSHLLQECDIVTRFGRDGQRHSSAWRRQLQQGEEFSLCVPTGVMVTNQNCTRFNLHAMGLEMLHFQHGWAGPVQISLENEVLWDSENLIAPSRQLPLDLRDFSVYLVLDRIGDNFVRGHLQINGINPVNVSISSENQTFDQLTRREAIQFGINGRHLAELWGGSKVKLIIQAQAERNHTVYSAWKVTLSNVDNMTPLLLGKNLDGKATILRGERPVETIKQFQSMKIMMIARTPIIGATLLQNGFSIGVVDNDTKDKPKSILRKKAPKCLGRKIPFFLETFNDNDQVIAEAFLMGGVVERGIIEKVGDFKKDGSAFEIELTHRLEPSLVAQPDGKNHRILIFSHAGNEPGNRIRTTVVEGENSISLAENNSPKWKVRVAEGIGNILGVAVCYGDTMLGCWTQGGKNACQKILNANDLTNDEVILLADFLRWFHLPFFDADLKDSVIVFFSKHAASVIFRWETGKALNWGQHSIFQSIAEPEWDRVLRALVNDTISFLQGPICYKGLCDLIKNNVTLEDSKGIVNKMISIVPGCVTGLSRVVRQHNWDHYWLELQQQYESKKKRKRSKDPLNHLSLTLAEVVTAALDNGVRQARGQNLHVHALRQLNDLMSFPAFCRLLALKIHSTQIHPAL
jgi:hypothetical protein